MCISWVLLQAGYYCSVCECILRDSQSYLDHINGKFHNRALGMSMRVERSTANDVRYLHPLSFLPRYHLSAMQFESKRHIGLGETNS